MTEITNEIISAGVLGIILVITYKLMKGEKKEI